MIVANYVNVRPTMNETHIYEDFFKFIGTRPTMLGIVSRMNTDLTADFLTRSLMNIYYNDEKKANKFQAIDSMYWEWEIGMLRSPLNKFFKLLERPKATGKISSVVVITAAFNDLAKAVNY